MSSPITSKATQPNTLATLDHNDYNNGRDDDVMTM